MSLSDARRQSHRSNLVGRCLPLIGQVAEAASSAAAAVFFVLCAMNDDTARSAQCKIACQTHPVIQWRRDVTGAPAYTAGNSEISQGVPAAIRACNFWPCSSDCPVTAKLRWFASKWTFGDQSASQWPSQTRYAPRQENALYFGAWFLNNLCVIEFSNGRRQDRNIATHAARVENSYPAL